MVSPGLRKLLIFTAIVFVVAGGYFIYAEFTYAPLPDRETMLGEIGEGFGEAGLFALVFIYARTFLKLVLGKGPLARRLLPDYDPPPGAGAFGSLLTLLDRTHAYVGIATVAVILLHIGLMGMPMHILFFPLVLGLVIWQGLFGMFLAWRYAPAQLRKASYLVHAQLFTGVAIGILAWFGHLLVDD